VNRQKVISALSGLRSSPAGRQLDTLFQFGEITIRDAGCLTNDRSLSGLPGGGGVDSEGTLAAGQF